MKTIASLFAAFLCFLTASAQTNITTAPTFLGGIGEIGDAIASATNWTATVGYGRSLKGNTSLGFADLGYNFSQNVGVIVGLDYISQGGAGEWNDVRGGISLSLPLHPFAFIGGTNLFTKMVATPFVADLLATPRSGAAIGNLIVTGAKVDLYDIKNFSLGLLGAYEHRMGQGTADGNYALIGIAITRKW
jgi:hypothetical protein